MNTFFFDLVENGLKNEHNSRNRKKAIEAMPEACVVIPVVDGYMGFTYWSDYEIWKNQR